MSTSKVVFFQVRDNGAKIQKIVETAHVHFEKKEPLLILVEDAKAQSFVDELLWKTPATSFLPHISTDIEVKEMVAIAKVKKNVNNASIAFNLCPTPLFIEGTFRTIYEFEEMGHPSKKNIVAAKIDAYRNAGYIIEAL